MENNRDSQLNRGRVIYRPKRSHVIIEDENETLPVNLPTEQDKQKLTVGNTDVGQDKNTMKKEKIKN